MLIDIHKIIEPYTCLSPERIDLLISLAEKALAVPGDMVECGVMNGGSAAILAYFAKQDNRDVWLFDSFEGLPPITKEDTPSLWGSYRQHKPYLEIKCFIDHSLCKDESHFDPVFVSHAAEHEIGKCAGDIGKVKEVLALVDADMRGIHIIKGWFQDTLSTANIPRISILNLDADWYESEKICLETFYDAVVPGGYIYFDDFYFWPGCQKAVTEFFQNRGLNPKFNQVHHAMWMTK